LPQLELEIVDDENGLLRPVHVEPCLGAFHLDPVVRPDTGLQIDVRLVLFRSLLPRSGEIEVRVRTVLGGVIPPDLVVGAAVGRPEIDVFVASIRLQPEGDADEPARPAARACGRLAGQIHFDGPVTKRRVLDDGVRIAVECVRRGDQPHRASGR